MRQSFQRYEKRKQELISATYKPPIGITASAEAREVKQFADLFEAAVHNGIYIPGMKSDSTKTNAFGMTVGEFITNHYFKRIEAKLSPNTVRFYRMITEQFIIPSFGNIRLTDINAKHLQAFIHYLSSSGSRADEENKTPLSAATVKRYTTVFSSVMTEACKMGYTEENKLRKASVEYPKIFRKTLEVYNDEEVRKFFHALQKESPQIKAMLLCALLLGLRRGEIVALQWSDIDFDKGTLSVNKSAYKNKGEPQKLKPPKSQTSIRTVFFPTVFAEAINEWKQLDVIRIGNRAYIAMEFFEEPYVSRFSPSCNTAFTTGKKSNHAIEQISTLLSGNTGIPTVKRVRRSA